MSFSTFNSQIETLTGLKTYRMKLVLLGDTGVGKSSLSRRFVNKSFYDREDPTIGASFLYKKVYLNDCIVGLEIWDTAGQERFHSLAPMYYRAADAALVVYDVTNMNSFDKAKKWINELHRSSPPITVIMLVCNKVDLVDDSNANEAKRFAKNNNLLFMEVSAKDDYNVDEMFMTVVETVPKIVKNPEPNVVILNSEDKPKQTSCCNF